jgi:hypothetical protein
VALTHGVELMQRLNGGSLEQAPSAYLQQTREAVSVAVEELLEVGARIRPLLVGDQRIGWIRGVHPSERKALKRWIFDEIELIEHLLLLGTTLALKDIRSLSMVEMRSLSRVIRAMTDSDLRLYPYISAFVTTNLSEQLWYSKGTEVTAFQERIIPLPIERNRNISSRIPELIRRSTSGTSDELFVSGPVTTMAMPHHPAAMGAWLSVAVLLRRREPDPEVRDGSQIEWTPCSPAIERSVGVQRKLLRQMYHRVSEHIDKHLFALWTHKNKTKGQPRSKFLENNHVSPQYGSDLRR